MRVTAHRLYHPRAALIQPILVYLYHQHIISFSLKINHHHPIPILRVMIIILLDRAGQLLYATQAIKKKKTATMTMIIMRYLLPRSNRAAAAVGGHGY